MLPQAKPQAFYAFLDLADKTHELRIRTPEFFPFTGALKVPMTQPLAEGILACMLEPGPMYGYPGWDGIVRGLVSRAKRPLPGVSVEASYTGPGGDVVTLRTRSWDGGSYDGRYALSFGARLPAETRITLSFVAPDGARNRREVTLSSGTTLFLDVDFN